MAVQFLANLRDEMGVGFLESSKQPMVSAGVVIKARLFECEKKCS